MPKKIWQALASLSIIAILWKITSLCTGPLILPPPETVIKVLLEILSAGETWQMTAHTAKRAATGAFAAVAAGILMGLVFFPLTAYIRPAVASLQNIPLISWVLLAVIWFGFTDATVSFVVFVATLPIIYLNTDSGTRAIDPGLVEMSRNYKIPPLLWWYGIGLASIYSHMAAGISVAIAIMWKSVVMAELFASSPGIGTAMDISRSYLKTDQLMAWTLWLILLGLASEWTWGLITRGAALKKVWGLGLRWLPIFKNTSNNYYQGELCGQTARAPVCNSITSNSPGNFIKVNNVVKGYGQKGLCCRVLENFTLQLKSGETALLKGPSGSGKTTLLRIIAGLETIESGTTEISGRASIMFQEPRLLPWFTAEENIIYVLRGRMSHKEARHKARVLLKALSIPPHFYPNQLSGGMQKAVALARTLAAGGDIFLLDEPFSSSDPGQKERMKQIIKAELKPANILLVVSHQYEDILLRPSLTITLEPAPKPLPGEYEALPNL